MIYYAGDTHGNILALKSIDEAAIAAGVSIVVQVGDFGCFFDGLNCKVAKYFNEREAGPVWYTCGGNHDNWPLWNSFPVGDDGLVNLAKDCHYVSRSKEVVLNGVKHLFFGGAESIDKHHRIEGKSWWPEETPTHKEFEEFFYAMERVKPDVVVTHDAPLQVGIWKYNRDRSPTPRNLDNIFNMCEHAPAYWMFGHHHMAERWGIKSTVFYCCGFEGDYISL